MIILPNTFDDDACFNFTFVKKYICVTAFLSIKWFSQTKNLVSPSGSVKQGHPVLQPSNSIANLKVTVTFCGVEDEPWHTRIVETPERARAYNTNQ